MKKQGKEQEANNKNQHGQPQSNTRMTRCIDASSSNNAEDAHSLSVENGWMRQVQRVVSCGSDACQATCWSACVRCHGMPCMVHGAWCTRHPSMLHMYVVMPVIYMYGYTTYIQYRYSSMGTSHLPPPTLTTQSRKEDSSCYPSNTNIGSKFEFRCWIRSLVHFVREIRHFQKCQNSDSQDFGAFHHWLPVSFILINHLSLFWKKV